ncbi:MAG: hypothetical protein Q6373_013960 [Candidatus Sigynarchaeota archaeon]
MRAWITFSFKVERDDEMEFDLSIGSNRLMILPVSALCALLCVLFAIILGADSLFNKILTLAVSGLISSVFVFIAFNIRRHLVYHRKEGMLSMMTTFRSHPISKTRQFDLSDIESLSIDARAERYMTRGIPATTEFFMLTLRTREHGNVDLIAGRDASQLRPVKELLDGAMLAGK